MQGAPTHVVYASSSPEWTAKLPLPQFWEVQSVNPDSKPGLSTMLEATAGITAADKSAAICKTGSFTGILLFTLCAYLGFPFGLPGIGYYTENRLVLRPRIWERLAGIVPVRMETWRHAFGLCSPPCNRLQCTKSAIHSAPISSRDSSARRTRVFLSP